METINDIVAEMRTLGRLDEKSTDKISRSLQGLGLRTYADRIEAAVEAERKGWQQKIYGIDLMLQRAIDSLSVALNRCDYNEFKQGE
jgi:hypothetical protein